MASLGIFGPTGMVGRQLLQLLENRSLPIKQMRLFGSPNSVGSFLDFKGKKLPVESASSFQGIDFAILCTETAISRELAPRLVEKKVIVIDHSSAFRLERGVPLIIPEVNRHALSHHKGLIASPNCTTTIMLLPLAPLHRRFGIKRIVAATYQAASGAGYAAVQELQEETRAFLEKRPFARQVIPHPYAFNLFVHNSPVNESGYVEEEEKMKWESRKILEDEEIQISATCIRVPILRAHSEALNVELRQPYSKEEVLQLVSRAPGVALLEDWKRGRFPMPSDATQQETVFCGRIREDRTQLNTIEMWVVGDQLLKGAALNSLQILELLLS